ncbi:MAG: O-antigen ligase family protein [Candidatus Hinthialibacter antarcticus]|nr:O-antigen ligase family protein [Candidatus Hinthialibacter antarcticus]
MNDAPLTLNTRHHAVIVGALAVLFFLAPLLPQLIHYDIAFAFRSFLYLCVAVLIAQYGWRGAVRQLNHEPFFLPAFLGVAASAVSLSYAPDFFRAGNAFSNLVALLFLWTVLRLMNFSTSHRRTLTMALVIGGAAAALQALYVQWTGHGELIEALRTNPMYDETMNAEMIVSLEANRAMGNFGNPNHTAGYFVLCLWPLWLLLRQSKTWGARIALCLAGFILTTGIYRTFSRSALLALALTFVLIALFEWLQRGGRITWKAIALSLSAPIIALAGAIFILPAHLFGDRLMTLSTIVARTHFYRGALAVIQDHPCFGVGLEGFEGFYAQHIRPGDLEARYVHNVFLESTVEGGLIGAVLLTWLLLVVFAYLWKRWRQPVPDRAAVWAAFGACSVFVFLSCVDFHNRLPELWYVPLFLMSAVSVSKIQMQSIRQWPIAINWALAILLFLCWGYFAGCKYANRLAADEGYYSLLDEKFYPARTAYERAVLWDPSDASSWNSLGNLWARTPTPIAQQTRLNCMHRAVARAPRRATLRADLAEALFALGYTEEAIQELRAAQALFPARPRYYDLAAKLYQALDRTEDVARMEETARRIKQEIEERN